MNILDRIVERKKQEIASLKSRYTVDDLCKLPLFDQQVNPLSTVLKTSTKPEIIAEFKRQSPSKGVINNHADPLNIGKMYSTQAAAISCLTDREFFGAQASDFSTIRSAVDTPMLRKEFIVDPFQVYETKAMGADIILLIAECLTIEAVNELSSLAKELSLDVLLEIHSADQLPKLNEHIDILGINNRNLKTFEVNIDQSIKLAQRLPKDLIKISESGLSNPETVTLLYNEGFSAFLMGENFMKSTDPGAELVHFCNTL